MFIRVIKQQPEQHTRLKANLTFGALLCGGLGWYSSWWYVQLSLSFLWFVIDLTSFPSPHWFIPLLFLPWAWVVENKTPNSCSINFLLSSCTGSSFRAAFEFLHNLGMNCSQRQKNQELCQDAVDTAAWINPHHCTPAFSLLLPRYFHPFPSSSPGTEPETAVWVL